MEEPADPLVCDDSVQFDSQSSCVVDEGRQVQTVFKDVFPLFFLQQADVVEIRCHHLRNVPDIITALREPMIK